MTERIHIHANTRYAIAYCHALRICAIERILINIDVAVYRHIPKPATAAKRPLPNAAMYRHASKPTATIESIIPNARHTVRYRYARKSTATMERMPRNDRHTVWDCHTRKPAAPTERMLPNVRHAVRNRYITIYTLYKRFAVLRQQKPIPCRIHSIIIRHHKLRQVAAAGKHKIVAPKGCSTFA